MEGGKVRREEVTEGNGRDSEAVALIRFFSRRVGGLVAVERLRVTVRGDLPKPVRFLFGESPVQRRGAGAQESGMSREDEDKGEEKGETDGLGVALRGVDVHPKWTEEGGGDDSSSSSADVKPSASESSPALRSLSIKGRRDGVRAKVRTGRGGRGEWSIGDRPGVSEHLIGTGGVKR